MQNRTVPHCIQTVLNIKKEKSILQIMLKVSSVKTYMLQCLLHKPYMVHIPFYLNKSFCQQCYETYSLYQE